MTNCPFFWKCFSVRLETHLEWTSVHSKVWSAVNFLFLFSFLSAFLFLSLFLFLALFFSIFLSIFLSARKGREKRERKKRKKKGKRRREEKKGKGKQEEKTREMIENCSLLNNKSYLVDPASNICLSQRLSHACLSINNFILWNCVQLIKSVIIYLMVSYFTWIPVVILELIHAKNPDSRRDVFIR